MRPGRHGTMSNGELEQIIVRNANFVTVRRAGSGDGYVSVNNAVTGEFILGINGGRLPEYSRMMNLDRNCPCSPGRECRTGKHGKALLRGWRNILSELVARRRVRVTAEIMRVLGGYEARQIRDYGQEYAPETDPTPAWEYQQLRSA